jgi:transglutaminase-like putative cysteine protease
MPDKFDLPSTDEQKISFSKNNTVHLIVTKPYLPPDVLYPLKDIPAEMQMYLQPSRYIESEDPLIQSMAKLAVRKTKRAKRAVNRIRRYVQFNIMPALNTPYATALETAKLNEGDCTEFALLTTALCRAAHIPARVVTGIAYLPFSGNFYYHAWTQVFIEGKWYSVDAALRMFDPGHIALSFSIDGAPDSKVNDCLGILKIKQLKTSSIAPVQ